MHSIFLQKRLKNVINILKAIKKCSCVSKTIEYFVINGRYGKH